MSESHRWYLFHKEVKSWDSIQPDLESDNFKTPARKLYLQMHLLAERFVFLGGDDEGFSERESQDPF
jgi:hypothetical protein